MSDHGPLIPSASDAPFPTGAQVRLDDRATFIDEGLLAGGSPWRLLRLRGTSRDVLERWRDGGTVLPGEERLARTLVDQGFLMPRFEESLARHAIDVVVPVYGEIGHLAKLLRQLEGYHVTVVDDGSGDPEPLARCAAQYGASLVRVSVNRGPGHARNIGAASTSREFLWFVDADVSIDDADRVARHLHGAFADPRVAAVAPRVRGQDATTWRSHFEHRFGPLDLGPRSGLVVPGAALGYVPSACVMVRRDAFGEGFDDALRVGEDVDFVWRLHDRGWLVRYDASVDVDHPMRPRIGQWWQQRHRYGTSAAALAERHDKRLAPFRSDPWTLLAWSSVLLGRPALGARVVAGARRHARTSVFRDEEDPAAAADQVVTRNMVRAGGPLARAIVRTFGLAILLAALHPRLRTRALALFALGTAWRWRHDQFHPTDLPFAIADDLAYGTGVVRGALQRRSLRVLTPDIATTSLRLRDVLGIPTTSGLRSQ